MNYGDFGYGYEDNYGYGGGGGNWGYGQDSGNGFWGQGGRSRKRRGNYDQLQQFEQRQQGRRGRHRGGWGNQGGWGDRGNDWSYGNDSYDDYGGNQWGNDNYYDDGYGSSRKRSRFYDDDTRGGQYLERGPHSVNFYDDYEDASLYRSETSRRRGRRNEGGRRRESDYGGWRRDGGRDRRSDPFSRRAERRARPRKKSDAEDAIYEKHKKVTVERSKREKIGHAVHAVVQAFKEVAQRLSQEKQDEEEAAVEAAQQLEAAQKEADSTNEDAEVDETPAAEEAVKNEEDTGTEKKDEESKAEDTESEKKDEASKAEDTAAKTATNGTEKSTKPKLEPVLLSSIKCGESAMRILVGEELQATVVVIAKKKPTRRLLERSLVFLEEVLGEDKRMKEEVFFLEFDNENEALVLKLQALEKFKVLIRFTSPQCSVDYDRDAEPTDEDPLDILTPENCEAGLIQLRRMRFFVKKLDPSPMCLTAVRILLFLRGHLEGFEKLPVWMLLLLVNIARNTLVPGEKVDPEKEKEQCRVDTLLVRCLQILSSGVLMPSNPGIRDPCEVDKDAGANISDQDAEAITRAAGELLRRIYFGQIRKVLDVEIE